MSGKLEKNLTTVFILGLVVSFSSMLFLIFFFNFTVMPAVPLLISVVLCAGLQITTYLAGVVFQNRIWPSVLLILCSLATAWVGILGPASIFGLPDSIAENYEKGFVSPIYFATLPFTLVGLGVGIAYLVMGIRGLLADVASTQSQRQAQTPAAQAPVDKVAFYTKVSDLLNPSEDAAPLETAEAVTPPPEENTPDAPDDFPPVVDAPDAAENETPPATEPAALEMVPFVALDTEALLAQWANTSYQAVPAADVSVVLDTDRLRIIRLNQLEFTALLSGIPEMERVAGLTPGGEVLDTNTQEAFSLLCRQALADSSNYKWYAVWIITSKAENKLMGSAGFKGLPDEDGEALLNFSINEAHHGGDYGAEATVALCRWALLQQDVHTVLAETAPADISSLHLMETAGMTPEEVAGNSCWRMAN